MNGYLLLAESYEKILGNASPEDDKALIQKKINVLKTLATFDEEDKYIAFDSSMFNDIFKGYIKMMMDELKADEDEDISKAAGVLASRMNGKASAILDRVSAKQAEDYL